MRMILATDAEKRLYASQEPAPLYPLHGFVMVPVQGTGWRQLAAVEDLRGAFSKPDPVWEAIAPAGYHFTEGVHTLLGYDLADLFDRVEYGLEPCQVDAGPRGPDCDGPFLVMPDYV